MELKLSDLLQLLKKRIWLFVAVVFIIGAVALLVSKFFIPPHYETKSAVLVTLRTPSDTQGSAHITHGVKLSSHMLVSSDFLFKVKSDLADNNEIDRELTEVFIRDSMKIESKDYEVTIRVNTDDKDLSYEISKSIERLISANQLIPTNLNLALLISQPAERVSTPVTPNVLLNTILGVFAGLVLGFLLILALDKLDTTVKKEEDLVERYNLPVLGVIYEHKDAAMEVRGYE